MPRRGTEANWSYCLDSPRPGQVNMDIDSQCLLDVAAAAGPRTQLRFYSWAEPTVSIGKNQQPNAALNLSHCREHNIPIVRRPTGGRAVYHSQELTYSVVSNDARYFDLDSIQATYRLVAAALQRGFALLGVDTQIEARGSSPQGDTWRKRACFASASRYELLNNRRKIVGSAQRRLKKAFLQHGSIPLRIDYVEMAGVLGVNASNLQDSMVSLSEVCPVAIAFEELAQSLRRGFSQIFQVEIVLCRAEPKVVGM